MIQGQFAGNPEFVGYLRSSLKTNKSWDKMFREMMLGPWDKPERKPAIGFLDKRARDLDLLTAECSSRLLLRCGCNLAPAITIRL